MASSQQTNNEDDGMVCPTCLGEFEDPRVLPCGHSLCDRCLQTLRRGGNVCPVCRASFAWTLTFPPNFALRNHRCLAAKERDAAVAEMEAMRARLEQAEDKVLTLQQQVRNQGEELKVKGMLLKVAEQETDHATKFKKEYQETIARLNAGRITLDTVLLECRNERRPQSNEMSNANYPWRLLFEPPALDRVKFGRKLENKRVALESVLLNKRLLTGTIRVANTSFQKRVFLRCTSNGWKTSNDFDATFHASVSSAYDSFTFEVTLPSNKNFSVCYCVGDQKFWDSNDGHNYKLISGNPSLSVSSVRLADQMEMV